MKTDDLITMLSSGPDVALAARPLRATALPLLGGLFASAALMLAILGLRPDLGLEMTWPKFWLKLVFSLALAGAGALAVKRLAAPGASLRALALCIAGPVLALWAVAGAALWLAAPESRADLFWGSTWRHCPLLIAVLSLPLLAAALHILRGRAPTRLRLAGAAAGFAAGGAAAVVYCLHCPEMSPAFVGTWYVLGVLMPTALGAVLGPRALAW